MNEQTTGLTLFQNDDLNVSNQQQCLEEEEAIEDRKRLDKELDDDLQMHLNDISFDIETSSINYRSHLNNQKLDDNDDDDDEEDENEDVDQTDQNQFKNYNQQQHQQEYQNINVETYQEEIIHLNNLYESKSREYNYLNQLYDTDKKNYESQINELTKRLSLAEAEKERSHMTRQQTHELLVESKEKISDLDATILNLKSKIKNLENLNTDLATELEHTKTMLSDVQHKYHMIARNNNGSGGGFNNDRHQQMDIIIKQTKERYVAQIDMMQQQIDGLRNKLDDKDNENKRLELCYKELQRSRESLLIEKSQNINQLQRNLEDSQRQCQKLLSKNDFTQENILLQKNTYALEQQIIDMEKTIKTLSNELETTKSELELLESVIVNNNSNFDDNNYNNVMMTSSMDPFRNDNNFINNNNVNNNNNNNNNIKKLTSTPIAVTTDERLKRLKVNLQRCILNEKGKCNEINKLKEQLNEKQIEIKKLRIDENKILVQMNNYKDKANRLECKSAMLENELGRAQAKILNATATTDNAVNNENSKYDINSNSENTHELKAINNQLEIDLNALHQQNNMNIKQIENLHNENLKLKKIETELEELKLLNYNKDLPKQTTTEQLELEKLKFLLNDSQNECDRIKNAYIKISTEKDTIIKELNNKLEVINLNHETDSALNIDDKKIENINLTEQKLFETEAKYKELIKQLETIKYENEKRFNDLHEKYEQEIKSNKKNFKTSPNNCMKCIVKITENTEFHIKNIQLQNTCTNYLKEINDLKLDLMQAKSTIDEYHEKISMKEEHDKLLSDLKEKATQFESYVMQHQQQQQEQQQQQQQNGISSTSITSVTSATNSSSSASATAAKKQRVELLDKGVSTSPDLDPINNNNNNKNLNCINELQINEDTLKNILTVQRKQVEVKFNMKLKESQEKIYVLENELDKLKERLEIKFKEVELLKYAILAERTKMSEIMESENKQTKIMFDKQNVLLKTCRDELELSGEKMQFLQKELEERNEQFNSERKSMDLLKQEWNEEKRILKENIYYWKITNRTLETDKIKIIEQLNSKYRSAKKTAANYKKYAEDKDEHIDRENERIKIAYQAAVKKIQHKYAIAIEEHEKKVNARMQKIQSQCETTKNTDVTKLN